MLDRPGHTVVLVDDEYDSATAAALATR